MKFEEWYSQPIVQWNIYRGLKSRYMSLKPSPDTPLVRYQKISSVNLILKVLEQWGVQEKHKLYMDIVQWKEMPLFSYHPAMRSKQKEDFTKVVEGNPSSYIEEVDFIIDIDAEKDKNKKKKDWKKTKERAIFCMKFLEARRMPYSVWNSSDNGFQFRVDGSFFGKKEPGQKIEHYISLAESMVDIKPDMAVYDLRRICKLPYSLCDGYVVLPLTREQLLNFKPEMVLPENVLKEVYLKDRGWLV